MIRFSASFSIDNRTIGPGYPPYIIAELSANHGGDLGRALRIIELAAEAGADAIKFQAYTPDCMTLDCDLPGFVIEGNSLWAGRRLYDLYTEAATPFDWFPELYNHARKLGITPLTTPFSKEAVEMLEEQNTPAYKIASFEAAHHELITACAETGKPLLISSGMCSKNEIEDALDIVHKTGTREVGVFRCNSGYPAKVHEANLLAVPDMMASFEIPVGFSDHTIGPAAAAAACALGASMIEKHFIDSPEPPTVDSVFSMVPEELTALVQLCRQAHEARGEVLYGPFEHERGSLAFRRSLYASSDIGEGGALGPENVRCIRPGHGLHPRHYREIMGRRVKKTLKFGEPISWDALQ